MSRRVILITGGNSAIGHAIAESFLAESPGNIIYLGVRQKRQLANKLAASFSERCRCVDLDVTQPQEWKALVDSILSAEQRLDVLVNNAGCHEDHLLATMPILAWQRVLAANLDSVFHGCQAVLPTMISQRHGRIINIASLSALLSPPGQTNYAAAKAGVVALTHSLAKEVARIGITVNVICPGYVDTEALATLTDEDRKATLARIPMRRFGQPAEIAAAVRFLACAEAGYITGSTLKVDGGIF